MRVADWELKLNEMIDTYRDKPFIWGESDCCLFTCDCIKAITGHDPAFEFRGKYNDEATAYQRVSEFLNGDPSLESLAVSMSERYGFLEIDNLNFCRRGDFGILQSNVGSGVQLLGINVGSAWAGMSERGVIFVGNKLLSRAWSVE